MRPRRVFVSPAAIIAALVLLLTLTMPAGLISGSPTPARPTTNHATLAADPLQLLTPTAQPSPTEPPHSLPDHASEPTPKVSVPIDGFLSWAYLDRHTGQTQESANSNQTSSTESMIKVWIVADHLRLASADGGQPSAQSLEDASLAIRDSHNGTTERLYRHNGADAVTERMIDICGLTDTYIPDHGRGWWSRTEMSARDAVRLGECIADGRAAGPEWTDWLLEEMRHVRGSTDPSDQRPEEGFEGGRWGIIDALPEDEATQVSIKNGWTRIGYDNSWHLTCLAITDDWVLAVVMRYPAERSLDYGAQRCAKVAEQVLPAPEPDPTTPPTSLGPAMHQ